MTTATVTPMRPKDQTARARSRRYRRHQRDAAVMGTLPDALDVVRLAARLGGGAATREDQEAAERMLMLFVGLLPATA